jgi:hypothetical protein
MEGTLSVPVSDTPSLGRCTVSLSEDREMERYGIAGQKADIRQIPFVDFFDTPAERSFLSLSVEVPPPKGSLYLSATDVSP